MASGRAPSSVSGASTPTPFAPEVCATRVPGRTTAAEARPRTRPASSLSGTARISSSLLAATSSTGRILDSGRRVRARCTDASEIADTPNTTCPARSNATPKAEPTRPAETIPTVSRAGAGSGPDAALPEFTLGEVNSVLSDVVPVPLGGYQTLRHENMGKPRHAPSPGPVIYTAVSSTGWPARIAESP